ncbi:phage tail tape measure protein [Schlesneria sp.]|uniref:phage tail tape measure protein n=1 Tax=Schlesneria sp. TaxID=2762018 RepID=UPI002EE35243
MTNTIGITWTSDSRQIFEDYQKRQIASDRQLQRLQAEIDKMKQVGVAGKQSAADVQSGYKSISEAIQKVGKGIDPGKVAAARLAEQKAAALAEMAAKKKADAEQAMQDEQERQRQVAYRHSLYAQRERARKQKSEQDAKDAADAKKKAEADQALRDKEIAAMRRFGLTKKEAAKEDYRRGTNELKKAHAAGELTDTEYLAGVAAHKRAYMEQIGLVAKRRAAERAAALEKKQNDREGAALVRSLGSEQDNLFAKVRRYQELLKAGSIDQKEYVKAVSRAYAEQRKMTEETKSSGDALTRLGTRLAGIATAYVSVTRAVQFLTTANREAQQAAEDAASKQEDLLKRFQVQAGLNQIQGRQAKVSIYKAAIDTATTSEDAFNTAAEMVSTGFSADQAQGPALTPFLKLMKAQALTPDKATSSKEMAAAFSMFLTANKKDLNAQNVEELATQIQGLKETPLKIPDLQQLAKHSGTLRELGGMSAEDQLANFAMLRKTQIAEEAGTHMREIVRQLATSKSSPKVVEQLNRMGLQPEDVDFKGEDFRTVMGRLKKGIESLPQEDRASALDIVVEGRNISSTITEMEGLDEVDDLKKKMNDKAGFAADVATTTTGKNATSIRQKTAMEMVKAAKDMNSKTMREAYELKLETSGLTPLGVSTGMAAYDAGNSLMGHEAFMMMFGSNEQRTQVGIDAMDRERNLQDAKTVIEDRKAQRKAEKAPPVPAPPPVNVNVNIQMPGNGEKPPLVPAAGLGLGGGR